MHFTAQTPHGPLHLELPAAHGADAVGAALALADAQPLLAALESWLGLDLDPRPQGRADAPVAPPPPGLLWCSAADNAHLGMPWPLLAQAPPSGMPALQGPELALVVDAARWTRLPPRPAGSGLLLLPAAFEAQWRVTLVQPDLGFEVDALWAGPGSAPVLAGAPRAAAETVAAVRLVQTLHWSMAAVLGWCQAPDTPLAEAARGWDAAATTPAFSGRIVPTLGGAGLLVQAAPVLEKQAADLAAVAA
jgi:hypothetical protein